MAERKKSTEFKPFGEVEGWRSSQVKCKEINFPLNVNNPYTVRSVADNNKLVKNPDHNLDSKKLPDLKKKSKSLQNKKFKYKGTDKYFQKLLVEEMSHKEMKYYKSVKVKCEKKNCEYLVKCEGDYEELGKIYRDSIRKNSNRELSAGKELMKKKAEEDIFYIDEEKRGRLGCLDDDENYHKKSEIFNNERRKNKPSVVFENIKDSESQEKKQPTLRMLETNSCFSKDSLSTPKLSKVDSLLPKQTEKLKSHLFIPNFDLISSKPDSQRYPPIKFKKNFSEISESIQKTPVSDSSKSHRSFSLSKITNEKEVQEFKPKDPITPNHPKPESKRWNDIQLTTIKEENFSQLSMKNRTIKQDVKSESTPKHFTGVKVSQKKTDYLTPKQRGEKKLVFSDIEIKPFSRDQSPEDLITQLRIKIKEIENAEKKVSHESGKNAEKKVLPESGNNVDSSAEKITKKKLTVPKKPKKTVKKKREESIDKKKNVEIPCINVLLSEPVEKVTEYVGKNGTDRFIDNYSISLISYIDLCLVDFKGNLGSMFEKIEKSHKQVKRGYPDTEILVKYKNKIKNKMIDELNTIFIKSESQLCADYLKHLRNSLKHSQFSQGIKTEMILFIDSANISESNKLIKSSLQNIIEKRLKYQTEYKATPKNISLSDSHMRSDSESSSDSSQNLIKPNSLSIYSEPSIKSDNPNAFLIQNPPKILSKEDSIVSQPNYIHNDKEIKEDLQKISESKQYSDFLFSSRLQPINNEFHSIDQESDENYDEPADLDNLKTTLLKRRFFSKDDTNTLIDYKPTSPRLLMLEPDQLHPSEIENEEVNKIIKHYRRAQHLKTAQKTFKKRNITRTFSNILKIDYEP